MKEYISRYALVCIIAFSASALYTSSYAATTITQLTLLHDNSTDHYSCNHPYINNSGYIATECVVEPHMIYAGPAGSTSLEFLTSWVKTIDPENPYGHTKTLDLGWFRALTNTNAILATYSDPTKGTMSQSPLFFYNNGVKNEQGYEEFFNAADTTEKTAIGVPEANDAGFITFSSIDPATNTKRAAIVSAGTTLPSTTPSASIITSNADGNCYTVALTNTTINNSPAVLVDCGYGKSRFNKFATVQNGANNYQTQTIPGPDGYTCTVTELNNKFHVAGRCTNSKGTSYAAFWADPTKAPAILQSNLAGETNTKPFSKRVFALNDLDHLMVTYKDSNGNSRILFWNPDTTTSTYSVIGVAGSNYTPAGLANNDTYVYVKSSGGTDTSYYRLANGTEEISLASATGAPNNLKATSISQNGLWIAATAMNPNGGENQVYRVSLGD